MDVDDLKWVANEKQIALLLEQFHENVRSKIPSFNEIKSFSAMQNVSWWFKLIKPEFTIVKPRIAGAILDL